MQTRLCPIDLEQGFPLLRGWHPLPDPEELFDLLLTDYQTMNCSAGRKAAGRLQKPTKKAVEKLCQPYLDWRKGALK